MAAAPWPSTTKAAAPWAATPKTAAPLAAASLANTHLTATLPSSTEPLLHEVLQNLHIPGRSVDLALNVSHAALEARGRVAASLREPRLPPQPVHVLAMPGLHGAQLLLQSADPLTVVLLLPPQVLHALL